MKDPWRGACAYHFYLLAQRQYYSGNLEDAIKTATHLRSFDDIIDPKVIYSLIAMISFQAKQYGSCSKAFIKLESLQTSIATREELEGFENLALSIFTRY